MRLPRAQLTPAKRRVLQELYDSGGRLAIQRPSSVAAARKAPLLPDHGRGCAAPRGDVSSVASAVSAEEDLELLQSVLDWDEDGDREYERDRDLPALYQREREAFQEWLDSGRPLSNKQRAWLNKAAVRLGVLEAAPAENAFSSMPEKKRAEEIRLARKQPYEDLPRPTKPPGRR